MEDPPRQPPLRGEGDGYVEEILEGLERLGALRGDHFVGIPVASGSHPPAHFGDGPGPILGSLGTRPAASIARSFAPGGVTMKEPMNVRR